MLTIIHGDDIAASRNYYWELLQKAKDRVILDGAIVTITDLAQALEGQDLFGESKQIFIEELISKRKSPKELDAFLSLITHHSSLEIVLWESKELTKKQVQPFSNATIKLFKIPSTVFALLDALQPENGKQLISLFHQTLADPAPNASSSVAGGKDPEFVFFMLQRQIRLLLACHSELVSKSFTNNQSPTNQLTISELSRLAPWQKGKLEKQAKLFSIDQLLQLHSKIFDIELGLKTGGLSLPLTETLDFLLLSI